MKPGFYTDIPEAEYHAGPGISKSGLDLVNKSARHYQVGRLNPKPSTPAQAFGSALHCLVLEPATFPSRYIAEPENAPKKPTEAQRNAKKSSIATLEAIDYWYDFERKAEGKIIISTKPGEDEFWNPSDWSKLQSMAATVYQHPVARGLLESPGRAELSYYWNDPDTGLLCRSRGDYVTDDGIIVDLKSAIDASLAGFTKSIGNWRYHVQNAFYSDGYEILTGQPPKAFVFLAIEKTPPYNVALYVLDAEAIHAGRMAYQADLRTYAKCKARDEWPGYCDDGDNFYTPRIIDMPPWALRGNRS